MAFTACAYSETNSLVSKPRWTRHYGSNTKTSLAVMLWIACTWNFKAPDGGIMKLPKLALTCSVFPLYLLHLFVWSPLGAWYHHLGSSCSEPLTTGSSSVVHLCHPNPYLDLSPHLHTFPSIHILLTCFWDSKSSDRSPATRTSMTYSNFLQGHGVYILSGNCRETKLY